MKGVSEFITTVLIIGITITVGILLFNWIEPLSRSQAEKVEEDSTNKLKCQSASLRISDGKLNTTSFKISVLAENTGTVNLDTFNFNILFTNGSTINSAVTPVATLNPSNKQTFTSSENVSTSTTVISSVRLLGTCNSAIKIHDNLDGNTFSTVT